MGRLKSFLQQKSEAAITKAAEKLAKREVRRIEKQGGTPLEIKKRATLRSIALIVKLYPRDWWPDKLVSGTRETLEREIKSSIKQGQTPTFAEIFSFYQDKEVLSAYEGAYVTDAVLELIVKEELQKQGLEA